MSIEPINILNNISTVDPKSENPLIPKVRIAFSSIRISIFTTTGLEILFDKNRFTITFNTSNYG